jgi:phenylacetic acid degradation operon negative regulatory protein
MGAPQASPKEIPRPPVLHQSLIITLFGIYRRTATTAIPVAALVDLLGDLGYDGPGVRSAVSRLKNKGVLKSESVAGVAAYNLAESVQATFDEGDQRIFAEDPQRRPNDWSLVLFSVPESKRSLRHQLRKHLRRLGFGTVASGVSIGAGQLLEQARQRLSHHGLAEYVQFFRGEYFFDGDVRDQVSQWWDLDTIHLSMQRFLETYHNAFELWTQRLEEPTLEDGTDSAKERDRQAFQYYVPMLTIWRRLPYEDPNLPAEYLPADWKEPDARRAFVGTHQLIGPLASRYVAQTVTAHLP